MDYKMNFMNVPVYLKKTGSRQAQKNVVDCPQLFTMCTI